MLDAFDYTKLTAIATCPVWGIIRYGMGLTPHEKRRETPLDAGHAAHEVFAAVRLLDAWTSGTIDARLFEMHGVRLLGRERFQHACDMFILNKDEDDRSKQLAFCLDVFATSGYEDDPDDRRRTVANIEMALIKYIDAWRWGRDPVWVVGDQVGIEVPFDLLIEHDIPGVPPFRYVGKIDAIHVGKDGLPRVHENKTASRVDETWELALLMSHQITGYFIAARELTGQEVEQGVVLGISLPPPRDETARGFVRAPVERSTTHYTNWLTWVTHIVSLYYAHEKDVTVAPRFTHSCSRYFRPCPLISFCDLPTEDQHVALTEMHYNPWSPLTPENEAAT
jgi:hypothetical protein